MRCPSFFFIDPATTEIYTLSLHDALPISAPSCLGTCRREFRRPSAASFPSRSEEHTSELQSRLHLVCRLLLEKKKDQQSPPRPPCIRDDRVAQPGHNRHRRVCPPAYAG